MKHKLLRLTLLLSALIAGSSVWAEDVTLAAGTNGSACTVNGKDGIKVGTSKAGGTMTITVPANSTKLTLHAAAWKGVSNLSVGITGATTAPSSITLTADDGISSNSPFTLSGNEDDFVHEITLSNITSETTLTLSADKRFVVWGASAVVSGGGSSLEDCDLALTYAPVALNFDLYNNTGAQFVEYTTSSTGTVTVSASDYVTTAVDQENKKIAVTPQNVTPSVQTITVSQAADENYKAGSVTFTVTITDSTPIPTHKAVFSVNGDITEQYFEEGAAIEFPATPDNIYGKAFVGWTHFPIAGTTDVPPTIYTSATMGDSDVFFYAVYAYASGSGPAEVTDVLNLESTGVTGTSYSEWSDVTATSAAVYAGQSAGGNDAIQLRTTNSNSGIVTTTSGGKVAKVSITWNSNTSAGRTVNVYGSDEAYSAATDLYGNSQGTLLGTIVCGTSTELSITDDYEYVGLRSASGALYLDEVEITWSTGGSVSYSDYCTTVAKVATFSYEDYPGEGTKDYGSSYTMIQTDVRISHNKFYCSDTYPSAYFYGYGDVGEGVITITPTGGATITRIEITTTDTDHNGWQTIGSEKPGEIIPSVGEITANNEDKTKATMTTWTGSSSEQFTITNTRTIVWSSIKVYYTGGLPKCATPAISGETSFITYSTVSISCATEGATIQYSTSTDGVNYTAYQPYTGLFQVSQTTTVKAQATKEGMVPSDEAYKGFVQHGVIPNIRYFISSHATNPFTDPEYLLLEDALVTYKNGNTAYIEDAYGAIMLYNCADDVEAGDKIHGYMKVTGYNPSYNGLPEITGFELVDGYVKTQEPQVNPTVVTLAEMLGGGAESSPYEGWLSKYVKIENATVTSAFDGKNCTIEQGGYSIILRDQNSTATLTSTVGDVVTVTGLVAIYNSTKQIAVYEQSQIVVTGAPASITVSTTSVEAPAAGDDGAITVTYNNIKDVNADIVWYTDETATTFATEPEWISAEINASNNVEYLVDANTGAARTAYMKVYALDDDANDVYSELITISQDAYVEVVTYTLASSIVPGKHYIIVGEKDGAYKAMGEQKDNNRAAVAVTESSGTIIGAEGVCEFVVYGPNASGFYTLYDAEKGYLYAGSSSSNYLKSQTINDMNGKWAITFDGDKAILKAQGSNSRNLIRYNSSSTLFSCYASGQQDVYLYEKDGDTPVATTTSVTLNSDGFATFASTSVLDFLDAADADFSAWEATSAGGSTIKFTQITSTVKAGTGIMLYGTPGASIDINILPVGGKDISATNLFVGVTEPKTVAANEYFGLSGNEFVKVGAGTVPAGKALLPASVLSGGVKAFTFDFGDDANGISLTPALSEGEEAIYNLAGQRLQKMQKGINIVNGKKVLK